MGTGEQGMGSERMGSGSGSMGSGAARRPPVFERAILSAVKPVFLSACSWSAVKPVIWDAIMPAKPVLLDASFERMMVLARQTRRE